MMLFIEISFWVCVGLIAATYFLYPLGLLALTSLRGKGRETELDAEPAVSLVICAYNEAEEIAAKLDNCLALDYPADKLEIIVISDASDDGTDEIVQSYAKSGVKLFRQEQRAGKSSGLTRYVPRATGEVIIFSDANAMYQRDAVRQLVRHFADETVGFVVGQQKYHEEENSQVSVAEQLYMNYESVLKQGESQLGSVVGGDGAIYAIRSHLFQPLRQDDISDFVNPLQIVAQGYRGIFEPRAVCHESAAAEYAGEFRRKVRIVNRSLRGLLRVPQVLNPFHVGWFSFQIVLHKLVRWFVPLLMIGALAANICLVLNTESRLYQVTFAGQLLLLGIAALGLLPGLCRLKPVYVTYYFLLVNTAAALGILSVAAGKRFTTWNPERSASAEVARTATKGWIARLSIGLLVICWAALSAAVYLILSRNLTLAQIVFGSMLAALSYIYLGYYILLSLFSRGGNTTKTDPPWRPDVSLIIPAFNEANVLEIKLKNTLALDYPQDRLEIIVVNDGSDDRTQAIAESFIDQGVSVRSNATRRGKSAALNNAIQSAKGDVLCLCDANVIFATDALKILVERLAEPNVGAVSGDVRLASHESTFGHGERLYYSMERSLQLKESQLGSLIGVDGGMYVVHRSLVDPIPADTILDDFTITMGVIQKGKRVVFEPRAIASEGGTPTALQEFRRRIRLMAGAVQSIKRWQLPPARRPVELWQYVSHKLLRWISPALLWILLIANLAIVQVHTVYAVSLAGQCAVYLLALAGFVSLKVRELKLVSIAFYVVLSNLAMAIGLARGLLNTQPAAWARAERTPIHS